MEVGNYPEGLLYFLKAEFSEILLRLPKRGIVVTKKP